MRYVKNGLAFLVVIALTIFITLKAKSFTFGYQNVGHIPAEENCFQLENISSIKVCIYIAKQGVNGNIAYYLHGRGNSERTWNDDDIYTAQIQKVWADQNVLPPTVISISFGPLWLLAPKGNAEMTGLLETVFNQAIPEIEKRLGTFKKRMVFGESMGGLNTLMSVLYHPEMFDRAAALCPVFYKDGPDRSMNLWYDFLSRTGADPFTIFKIKLLAKAFATTEAEWSQIAPLDLLEKVDSKSIPPLYLSCGLYDKYGNYEAVSEFSRRAVEKGLKINWHPLYGPHCAVDVVSVAKFLSDQ